MSRTRERWIGALAATVCILVILSVVTIIFDGPHAAPREMPPQFQRDIDCFDVDPETRERIRTIMLEAIDAALKDHIMHTFEVWMRDDRDQPARAGTGVRQGIRAYLRSRASVLKWDPKPC